jgi:hypothetical protein
VYAASSESSDSPASVDEAEIFTSVALFGLSAGVNSFFIAPGGGVDFQITRNIWLRSGADWLHTSKYGVTMNGIRALGGFTFRSVALHRR